MNDKDYITPKELADRWHKSPRTLANQRMKKRLSHITKYLAKRFYMILKMWRK